MQCIKVAGDHVEWEHGGNRTVQIAEGPCQVAFDWGDEGSLRVELANGQASGSNGHVEAPHEQEPSPEVRMRLEVIWQRCLPAAPLNRLPWNLRTACQQPTPGLFYHHAVREGRKEHHCVDRGNARSEAAASLDMRVQPPGGI